MRPGRRLFVEGASTGTGLECPAHGPPPASTVVGMVSSSEERAERVRELWRHAR
jgi:acrylyl-CoA reductase (NADPH)/3-hydroxypropionyl-CoA dehydratase/3-hydroxypropionyl-CoA synthetase